MRVVNCVGFGPVRDLTVEDRPSPQVQPGTVKVAVRACGVNFVDGLLVEGKYQIRPPLPFRPEHVEVLVSVLDEALSEAAS